MCCNADTFQLITLVDPKMDQWDPQKGRHAVISGLQLAIRRGSVHSSAFNKARHATEGLLSISLLKITGFLKSLDRSCEEKSQAVNVYVNQQRAQDLCGL